MPDCGLMPLSSRLQTSKAVSVISSLSSASSRNGETEKIGSDGVRMMIGHCPDALSPADLGDHSYFAYLLVDDVDILHAEFVDRGAIILHPPTNKAWGRREMAIATPEGHRMMIAQQLLSV